MLPAAVRSDPDAQKWATIVAFYVGKGETQQSIKAFVKALRAVQVADGLVETASDMRVRRRIDLENPASAQPEAVWEEAVALRATAPWLSGLLALLAAGHYAEATGVVGLSNSGLSCERLLKMLDCFDDAIYISAFDKLIPPDVDALPAPSQLKTYLEFSRVNGVDDDGNKLAGGDAAIKFAQREAVRLERRRAARLVWTFSDEVHNAFAQGRSTWQKERRSTSNPLNGFLKYAAMMALDSGFSVADRKRLWRDNMTQWILSRMSGGSAAEIGMVHLYRMMANGESALARELRSVLQFGTYGKDPLARYAKKALRSLESVQINPAKVN